VVYRFYYNLKTKTIQTIASVLNHFKVFKELELIVFDRKTLPTAVGFLPTATGLCIVLLSSISLVSGGGMCIIF